MVALDADTERFGNPRGTLHGGTLCELADAAIATAHSTPMVEGETFTSVELNINFVRPVWRDTPHATARPFHSGRTIACYQCEITRGDGKVVAQGTSTVMTLRGEQAKGR